MKHVFIVNPVSGKADASLYLVPRLIDAAGNRCAFTPAAGTVL